MIIIVLFSVLLTPPIVTGKTIVTDRIVVSFSKKIQQTTIFSILAGYNLTVIKVIPSIDAFVLKTPQGKEDLIIDQLNTLDTVIYAERIGIARGATTPTDPDYGNLGQGFMPHKRYTHQTLGMFPQAVG